MCGLKVKLPFLRGKKGVGSLYPNELLSTLRSHSCSSGVVFVICDRVRPISSLRARGTITRKDKNTSHVHE